MKVLILGGSGYVGGRLYERLSATAAMQPCRMSHRELDTCDRAALTRALTGIDAVINCVAGDYRSIAEGARELAYAAQAAKCARIIHFSSLAAYGRSEGLIGEGSAFDPGLGWYARAKCEAEAHITAFALQGGQVVTLRPGCVYGPDSQLWVGRLGRWLCDRRVGDLGSAGDGWSNLVHIDDVCDAAVRALTLPVTNGCNVAFNLAASDSPRWNVYLRDLAIAIGAIPVRRVSSRRLWIDSAILGPPLKAFERLLDAVHLPHEWLPDPLPPSVLRLWSQDIRLNARAATEVLQLNWIRYEIGLEQSARWFLARHLSR